MLKQYPELIFTTQKGNCYMPSVVVKNVQELQKNEFVEEKKVAESEGRGVSVCPSSSTYVQTYIISLCYEAGMDTSSDSAHSVISI